MSTAVGALLVALALRDVFDALFHPEGRGTLARGLMRALWLAFRRVSPGRPRRLALAGPLMLVVVIATWAGLLVLGWALIFWPHVPEGLRFEVGVKDAGDFADALNLSLVTITTLGFGDVTPDYEWLRIVTPVEAFLGFGLLSASISWLLLIYPVLARKRSLAYEVWLLLEGGRKPEVVLERLGPAGAERLFAELTSRLVAVERDLVNFPIAYYFAEADDRFSLAAAAPYMQDLAERGTDGGTRLRAQMLLAALGDFARTASAGFHGHESDSVPVLLEAYARDQMRVPHRGLVE